MIGGLLASQICGEEEILGTKCQDIAVVYGAIGGAALGYVIEAKLGNHDGFQYIIQIERKAKCLFCPIDRVYTSLCYDKRFLYKE